MITYHERYMWIDEDESQFIVQNGSLKILEDSFPVEVDIIERTYTEGSIAPGEHRGLTKQLQFKIDINYKNEQEYRSIVNNLLSKARLTRYIRDRINKIETEVRLDESAISYDEGGQFHGSIINFTFNQLIPFWEDVEYITEFENVTAENQIVIDNDGYFETWPVIILQTQNIIPKFLVKVEETGRGIGINDLNFGKFNLQTYIIDCKNGEALLSGILRNNQIIGGTGFFPLRIGMNTINCYTWQNLDLNMTVKYKRRFFI